MLYRPVNDRLFHGLVERSEVRSASSSFHVRDSYVCSFPSIVRTMNAAAPGVFSMSFNPFSGPSTATADDRPSVLKPSGPTTVTLL